MLYIYNVGGNIIALVEDKHRPHIHDVRQVSPFDQLIIWRQQDFAVILDIYNFDGSKAAQCGNGLSALAYHLNLERISISIDKTIYHAFSLNRKHWIMMGCAEIKNIDENIYDVRIGNKHIITLNQPYDEKLNKTWEKSHNISHVCTSDQYNISIRTYERGCGRTGSCASASTATCALLKYLNQDLNSWLVYNPSGLIEVIYQQNQFFQSGFPNLIDQLRL
jgi:diaminopimelate epimerase